MAEENQGACPEAKILTPEEQVERDKQFLLRAAASIDPLGAVRRHPGWSVGCALLGGICVGALKKPMQLAAILPLALQTGDLLLKMMPRDKN